MKRCHICHRQYFFDPDDRVDGCCSCYFGRPYLTWVDIVVICLVILFVLWVILK